MLLESTDDEEEDPELNIRVEEADDVVTYLGLASIETKLIKINFLDKNDIRLEEQLWR